MWLITLALLLPAPAGPRVEGAPKIEAARPAKAKRDKARKKTKAKKKQTQAQGSEVTRRIAEGDERFEADDLRGARRAYEAALERAPTRPDVHYRLALVALLLDQPAVALRRASDAARFDPGNRHALALAALALERLERPVEPEQIEAALSEGRVATAAWMSRGAAEALADKEGVGDDPKRRALRTYDGQASLGLARADAAPALRAGALDRAAVWVELAEAAALAGDLPRARHLAAVAAAALDANDPSLSRVERLLEGRRVQKKER